ncbi:OmpH family outer membrane protein [Rapidithrix thailandica]|uniref:OmpH family outer membrane protein n=1 Tax=Rapidithrix thailandica TaxID=413964 RepID=A0AAW9SFI6_9BACT
MKKSLQLILIIILLVSNAVLYFLYFSTSQKMAYVDSNQLLNGYQGMIDARAAYQQKTVTWQANIDTLTQEIHKKLQDYEKNVARMSKKEKELSQELLKTKQQQLGQYQEAIRQKAQAEDQKLTESVINEVNAYLAEYGKKQNYQIILAATNAGNIVYAEEMLNITEEVLKGLNKNYVKP